MQARTIENSIDNNNTYIRVVYERYTREMRSIRFDSEKKDASSIAATRRERPPRRNESASCRSVEDEVGDNGHENTGEPLKMKGDGGQRSLA
mmetsp:Transcript_4603/g.9784  ORF Transcript_4603/g.9784 Transcript_4603/m.9784 type:complete len:92 (+) Transcript_4603:1246-1521(+)